MDFIFEERPSDSPFVERVWQTQSSQAGTFLSQAVSHWEMVIWRYQGEARVTMRGPETQSSIADSPADAEFLGIRFKLGTFMPRLTGENLVNNELLLPEAAYRSFWLHGDTWQIPNFEQVDTFIGQLARKDLIAHDPIVSDVLQGYAPALSPRALQYRFLRATGLTQSTIRQIERARQAAEMLAQGRSIADTVFEAGYFDQPHMTRSLKRFLGQTPSQILLLK